MRISSSHMATSIPSTRQVILMEFPLSWAHAMDYDKDIMIEMAIDAGRTIRVKR